MSRAPGLSGRRGRGDTATLAASSAAPPRRQACPMGCAPLTHEPPCTVGRPIPYDPGLYDLAALDARELQHAAGVAR